MGITTDSIYESALALSEEERFSLAEVLISSLDSNHLREIEAAWSKVIDQRSTELKNRTVQPVPWSEVKHQAKEKRLG